MGDTRTPALNRAALIGVLAVLLASDAMMMILHVAYARTVRHLPTPLLLYDPRFSLSHDGGVAESVEYAKSVVTVLALFLCARRERANLFLTLAGVHLWLLLDNALRIHERAGAVAGRLVAPDGAFTLASRDLGQPIAFAAIGCGLAVMLGRAWPPPQAEQRRIGGIMALAAASIAIFAVAVDALHASLLGARMGDVFWTLLEDGGETVVLSLNCALALAYAFGAQDMPIIATPAAE